MDAATSNLAAAVSFYMKTGSSSLASFMILNFL